LKALRIQLIPDEIDVVTINDQSDLLVLHQQ
jgi:hypothetical protein